MSAFTSSGESVAGMAAYWMTISVTYSPRTVAAGATSVSFCERATLTRTIASLPRSSSALWSER